MAKVVQGTPGVDPIPKFNPCFNLNITTSFAAPNTFSDAFRCDSSNVLEVDMRDDTIEKQRLATKNKRRRTLYAQKKYEKISFLSVRAIDVKYEINAKSGPRHGLCLNFSLSNTCSLGNALVILFLKVLVITLCITQVLSTVLHRRLSLIVPR